MAFGTTNLFPDDSTAANFREWVQWIHDSFAAAGWIQTPDSGQIVIASAAAPTTFNQIIGYEIWRMNDALHAAGFPVYIRATYGSNSTGSGAHNLTVQMDAGFATDGVGNLSSASKITRIWQNGEFQMDPPMKSPATRYPCYFSGANNRILFHAFEGSTNPTVTPFICFERTKNDDGTDNADGVMGQTRLIAINPSQTNYGWGQQVALRGDAAGQATLLTLSNGPGHAYAINSLLYGANVNPVPWIIPTKRGYENPPRNLASYFNNEVADGAVIDVIMYGVSQKMRTPVGTLKSAAVGYNQTIDTSAQIMYRYGD